MSDTIVTWLLGGWLFGNPGSSMGGRDAQPTPRSGHDAHDASIGRPADSVESPMIERVRGGDESAFRDLWETYHRRLIAYARRSVGTDDLAADVVQDAFFALWVERETFAPRTTIEAYVYRMVRHRVLHQLRSAGRERKYQARVTADQAGASLGTLHGAEHAIEADEMRARVDDIIAHMTPRVREIFLLSREDGLTPPQIAETLGITLQVVYNKISGAVKLLAEGIKAFQTHE